MKGKLQGKRFLDLMGYWRKQGFEIVRIVSGRVFIKKMEGVIKIGSSNDSDR